MIVGDAIFWAGLVLAGQEQVAPPPPSDDIVVIGERMRRLKLSIRFGRRSRRHYCVVKRPSGDPLLDASMCDAGVICATSATTGPQIETCVTPYLEAFVRERAARRATTIPPAGAAPPDK